MAAESVTLADYITTFIQGLIGSEPVDVERVYELTVDLGTFEERLVRVFPLSFALSEPQTRKEDFFDVRIGIVCLERYTEESTPEKAVPTAWVDERVEFVEDVLFSPLANPRLIHEVPAGFDIVQYWAQAAEVTTVYDYTKLSQHKVFWSELEFVFRKLQIQG